jgi:hypothetical protein
MAALAPIHAPSGAAARHGSFSFYSCCYGILSLGKFVSLVIPQLQQVNIMLIKRLLLCLSLISALIISQAVFADNRHQRRGYDDHSSGNHNYRRSYRNNHHYSSRHNYRRNSHANSYHYGSRDRRYGNHFNVSYGNYYPRHRRHDANSFVGGLVLGSLFSYSRSHRQHETIVYTEVVSSPSREVVYVNQAQSSSGTVAASGRRLLRDLEGNCFERIRDEQGNEMRIQLETEECNF